MKYFVFPVLVIISTACSSKVEDRKAENKKLSVTEQNAICARVGRTINHGKCYDKGVNMMPVVKLNSNMINQGEVFSGKVYFPTPYFQQLAKCYNFTYKTKLSVGTMLMPIEAQHQTHDTVFFKVSPDSLTRVKQGKEIDEYNLRAGLRASFSNGVSGYDTTMMANVKVFVRRH